MNEWREFFSEWRSVEVWRASLGLVAWAFVLGGLFWITAYLVSFAERLA